MKTTETKEDQEKTSERTLPLENEEKYQERRVEVART